jgi:predicted nucleotidyltransferase
MPASNFRGLLRVLASHGVEFVVVGGVSAVLQGAPVNTFDLDVVHSTEPANVERLLAALAELEAVYRTQPERRLKPGASHLASAAHQLLMTRFGPLDLLGRIGASEGYRELEGAADAMEIGGGLVIRVLKLEALIRLKEALAGEKDHATLPILRRTLAERKETERET